MKAYVVVTEVITDPVNFDQYRSRATTTLEAFEGRFVTRGGNLSIVEGEWPLPRLVIIEFPSRAHAEGWYASPAYQEIIPLRLKGSRGNFVIVDGMPG